LLFETICLHRKFISNPQAFKPFIESYLNFLLKQDKVFATRKACAYVNLIKTKRIGLMPVLIEALGQLEKSDRKHLKLKRVHKQKKAVSRHGDANEETPKSNRSPG